MGIAKIRRLSRQDNGVPERAEPRYWHYTAVLENILESSEIQLATRGLPPHVRPATWFSTNPQWERTVRKRLRDPRTGAVSKLLSREGLFAAGLKPARIEVSPELPFITWEAYRQLSGESPEVLDGLETAAQEWGADSREWRAVFAPVPRSQWKAVEVWDGKTWQEVNGH